MRSRTLAAVAQQVSGTLLGADAAFGRVSIDTRNLDDGALFVAIPGERFDGNDFVPDAHARSAAGALVSRPADVPLPQVRVGDTRGALTGMARGWRKNFPIPVVAVTGSNGKTTVKELIAGILGVSRDVCVTRGNLNNDLGVPLTLMELAESHEVLVVELGANHAGEIAALSRLAGPTVGVITNAGAAHLEGFGSIDGVARAKGELLDHLPAEGTAILNADDRYCSTWRRRSRTARALTFGFDPSADCTVRGEVAEVAKGSAFTLVLPDGTDFRLTLPLRGRHSVLNALAAAAATHAVGAPPDEIRAGLSRARPVGGRLNRTRGFGGAIIIDDTYNANPNSARAALDYLRGRGGRRMFVLGDMAELGADAVELHRQVGEYARDCCDTLFAIGDLSHEAARAFGSGARSFTDLDALRRALRPLLSEETTLLVKGSRVMGLDRLVGSLGASGAVTAGGAGAPGGAGGAGGAGGTGGTGGRQGASGAKGASGEKREAPC